MRIPNAESQQLPRGYQEYIRRGLPAHAIVEVVAAYDAVSKARKQVCEVLCLCNVVLPPAAGREGHGDAMGMKMLDEPVRAGLQRDSWPE